jgi:hypothetical protein
LEPFGLPSPLETDGKYPHARLPKSGGMRLDNGSRPRVHGSREFEKWDFLPCALNLVPCTLRSRPLPLGMEKKK